MPEYSCINLHGFGSIDKMRVAHHESGTNEFTFITLQHDCDRFREHEQVTVAINKKTVEQLIYDLMEIHAEMV